jgi:hypothetical protein
MGCSSDESELEEVKEVEEVQGVEDVEEVEDVEDGSEDDCDDSSVDEDAADDDDRGAADRGQSAQSESSKMPDRKVVKVGRRGETARQQPAGDFADSWADPRGTLGKTRTSNFATRGRGVERSCLCWDERTLMPRRIERRSRTRSEMLPRDSMSPCTVMYR